MAKNTRFTDKFIMNLKPAEKEYWTREGQGFAIRVLPSGEKVWYFIYTFEGRKRFMRLKDGGYPDVSLADARETYELAKVKVKNGIDPLEVKRKAELERKLTPTVADFINEYVERYLKPKVKRWKDVERSLQYDVVHRWGKRKITDITRRDIILLRDEVTKRAPIQANRLLAYVSGLFSFAIDQDVIKDTPYSMIKRATKEEPKERSLTVHEIKQFWLSLDTPGLLMMSQETRTALKLILLTAQRPGEVIGINTDEIEGHWWTIPKSRTKNKRTHRVYLTGTALDLIGNLNPRNGYIFPAGHGKNGCIAVNALSFALRRNIKGQSLETNKVKCRKGEEYKRGPYKAKKPLLENLNRIGLEMFGAHDLRRTAATLMALEKVPFETRERVLNHTMGKLDDTYNQHDFDDEKQMAMETIERKLNNIITDIEIGQIISVKSNVI